MLLFILKFSACLSIFMVFYKLCLERENMHMFKRFYLLGVVLASLIIPFITFTEYIEPQFIMGSFLNSIDESLLFATEEIIEEPPINYTPIILWSLYSIGVLVFSLKFVLNLKQIILKIKNNPKQKTSNFISVLLNDLVAPHTFFSYIFLNKTKFENNQIPQEVLLHEETHASQKHSLDILFIELFQIIFWFNPLVYFLKKDIKLNHEFLADQAVIKHGTDTKNYQNLLLAFSSDTKKPSLAHAINYSLIKKRFTVMKTKTSKQSFWIRSFILLPLLAILVYSFSTTKQVEKELTPNLLTSQDVFLEENTSNENEATKSMMEEYKTFTANYKKTRQINGTQYNRIVAIYNLMSEEQKQSVEKYVELPFLNVSKTRPSVKPTNTLLNAWKDKSTYAVWIDGKVIENSILNNYTTADFVHYSKSKVYKNARSERFPQPFQVRIYTKPYYKSNFTNRDIKKYKSLSKKYTDALNIWLEGDRIDNSELRILKAQADKVYNDISKEKQNEYHLKPTPPIPSINKVNKNQKEATPKQVAEYNKLAKKYNAQPEDKRIIKLKDVKRLEYLFNLMNNTQKANVEPFPNCPPPPPPAPKPEQEIKVLKTNKNKNITLLEHWYITIDNKRYYYPYKKGDLKKYYDKYGNEVRLDIVKEYTKKYNRYEALRAKEPHYINKSAKEQKEMDVLFSDLGGMYFRMTRNNKAKVKRPTSPVKPYVKIALNGKIYYKKHKELTAEEKATLPPPPPPPIPENATSEQKAKHQKANKAYKNAIKKYIDNTTLAPSPPTPENKLKQQQAKEELYLHLLKKREEASIKLKSTKNSETKKLLKESVNSINDEKGWMKIDGDTYYYVVENNNKKIFNRWGVQVDEKGNPLTATPSETNYKKSKGGPNASDISGMSEDYKIRKLILKVSTNQKEPLIYMLNGRTSNFTEIENYIKKNNESNLSFSNEKINTLSFSDKKEAKMSKNELQNVYSLVFKNYIQEQEPGFIFNKINNKKSGPNANDYSFSENNLNKSRKRTLTISVSKKGEYAISKDEMHKNFQPISLVEIEVLISKLSSNEIENTFVFSKSNDLKKFRSKPSKSKEYQNDIEIYLIKSDPKSNIFTDEYRKEKGYTLFEFSLDNKGGDIYKHHTEKLAKIFKKHGITNITL